MTNDKLQAHFTPEFAIRQAQIEPDSGITSVGGLATRAGDLSIEHLIDIANPDGEIASAASAEKEKQLM